MTICKGCAEAGDYNRQEAGDSRALSTCPWFVEHPDNCGCPCKHRDPAQWEDMYITKRPEVDGE